MVWLTMLFQRDPIKNLISLVKIEKLHARDQTSSKRAFEKSC